MTGAAFTISTFAGWADMDANAHMGNFAYLSKCVDARMGFFKQHGLPVAEFAKRHIGPVVRRDELEYHREIGLHEPITVTVTLALAGLAPDGSRFRFINEILKGDGRLAARIRSEGGWMDLVSRKLIAPPGGRARGTARHAAVCGFRDPAVEHPQVNAWKGRCHCGAIGFEYSTAKPPGEWPVRACQCSYCLKHGGTYTSDPAGSVRFVHEDTTQVSRYRFGQKTADFVFCGRCGGYLGALTEEGGQALMVMNLRAFDPQPEGLPAAKPMTYEGETTGDRNTRRSARWTPVRN